METSVPLGAYLGLGLFMFTIGAVGVIIRRNPIVIFMCVELMLNAVNLTTIAFAKYGPLVKGHEISRMEAAAAGQVLVIFVMAVAAAEVAVGIGIIMAIYRLRENISVDEMNILRG